MSDAQEQAGQNIMPATDGITQGMEVRRQRGLEIAALVRIDKKENGTFVVPSSTGNGKYTVNPVAATCTCPDFETRGCKCKHQYAVEFYARRETTTHADGSVTIVETVAFKATKKKTYSQNWPAYNEAQTNEQDQFLRLLGDLCANVETPAPKSKKGGRPTLPLADAVFACTFKIYSTFSGRRFISDLRAAHADGMISRLPHYNSIFNYLENPELSPILIALIIEASKPLAEVETAFAVDSTGFTSSRFHRWFDHKYGGIRQEHDWVKAHVCCGVKTNVVTAVEIKGRHAGDPAELPGLLNTTAETFTVGELSGDKAYASIANFKAIDAVGATPFIPFKARHTGASGGLFARALHFFRFNQDEFYAHYHKRSNVESTFSMIKAKFRDHVRSKTETAMKNEVLCKILCHNICCLISAFYELGIDADFRRVATASGV